MEAWSLYAQHSEPNHCYSRPNHNTQLGYEHWNKNMVFSLWKLVRSWHFIFFLSWNLWLAGIPPLYLPTTASVHAEVKFTIRRKTQIEKDADTSWRQMSSCVVHWAENSTDTPMTSLLKFNWAFIIRQQARITLSNYCIMSLPGEGVALGLHVINHH